MLLMLLNHIRAILPLLGRLNLAKSTLKTIVLSIKLLIKDMMLPQLALRPLRNLGLRHCKLLLLVVGRNRNKWLSKLLLDSKLTLVLRCIGDHLISHPHGLVLLNNLISLMHHMLLLLLALLPWLLLQIHNLLARRRSVILQDLILLHELHL